MRFTPPKPESLATITVRLPVADVQAVDRLAADAGIRRSDVLRHAVRRLVVPLATVEDLTCR